MKSWCCMKKGWDYKMADTSNNFHHKRITIVFTLCVFGCIYVYIENEHANLRHGKTGRLQISNLENNGRILKSSVPLEITSWGFRSGRRKTRNREWTERASEDYTGLDRILWWQPRWNVRSFEEILHTKAAVYFHKRSELFCTGRKSLWDYLL